MLDWVGYVAFGAALGTLGGLFGIGGGLIAIPALGLLFGLDQQLAQGTALVMVVPNVLLALWRYHQRNRIDHRHAVALGIAGLVCAWLGSLWAVGLDGAVMRKGFIGFLMNRQDLDLTIVTREPGHEIGQLLRQERFVWAEASGFSPHERDPIPLAMFNTDCFCRAWACNALDTRGKPYRIAYTSPSLAAIMAVVTAGLAVTAQLRSLIPADMRILGPAEQLPELPLANVMLLRNASTQSTVTESLAEFISEGFRL